MRALAAAALLALALPAGAHHMENGAGAASAGQFLLIGVGARAAAMGEAYTAVVDDATALFWNPAALTRIEKRTVTLMHAAHFNSSSLEYGAYGQSVGRSAFGFSAQYMNYGSIIQTDAVGNRTGTFSPHDVAATGGFAHRLGNGLAFGVGGKFVRSKIADTAQTFAVDVGVLSQPLFSDCLRLGAMAGNLGGRLRYGSDTEKLPKVGRLGGAYRVSDKGSVSLDAVTQDGQSPSVAAGTEYWFVAGESWRLAGRFGVNSHYFDQATVQAMTLGLGFGLKSAVFDYAFVPGAAAGNSHLASLTFRF